jgi:hypothetical protein
LRHGLLLTHIFQDSNHILAPKKIMNLKKRGGTVLIKDRDSLCEVNLLRFWSGPALIGGKPIMNIKYVAIPSGLSASYIRRMLMQKPLPAT